MTQAFIYKWTHIPTKKWYIGVHSKQGCHPDDGYICSSKHVKPMILNSPSEWVREILYTGSPQEMLDLEKQILTELDAMNNPNSFNLHNGNGKFTTTGKVLSKNWVEKIKKGNTGKTRSEESKRNYKRASQLKAKDENYIQKLRKPKPPGHGEKVSASTKGKAKSDQHRLAMSKARKGKSTGACSDERRAAIKASLIGKHTLPLVTCPWCGLEGRANMKRWHFDNCKSKK